MLQVSRQYSQWEGYKYQCDDCEAVADSVSTIEHNSKCRVQRPDNVEIDVSDSSERQIRKILRNVRWLQEDGKSSEEIMKEINDLDGVYWVDNESTSRFAVGLGRVSNRGQFHRDDERGIVLKIDPLIRWNESHTPTSTNIDELISWETAQKTGTTKFFAEIFSCARDGTWLLMEECIPIRHSVRRQMKKRDIIYDDNRRYTRELLEGLQSNGWEDPDHKNGNMGLTDERNVVLLDYGTGPRHKSTDTSESRSYN